jgi:hypothetical protein
MTLSLTTEVKGYLWWSVLCDNLARLYYPGYLNTNQGDEGQVVCRWHSSLFAVGFKLWILSQWVSSILVKGLKIRGRLLWSRISTCRYQLQLERSSLCYNYLNSFIKTNLLLDLPHLSLTNTPFYHMKYFDIWMEIFLIAKLSFFYSPNFESGDYFCIQSINFNII